MIELINFNILLFNQFLQLKFSVNNIFQLKFLIKILFLQFSYQFELLLIPFHNLIKLSYLLRQLHDLVEIALVLCLGLLEILHKLVPVGF